MGITFVPKGDIFTGEGCGGELDIILNPVNCEGIMCGGLARAFAKRFPKMEQEYINLCNKDGLEPGLIHVWKEDKSYYLYDEWYYDIQYILNFPTKDLVMYDSDADYVRDGLMAMLNILPILKMTHPDESRHHHKLWVGIPALGCGLGGLPWYQIKNMLKHYLDHPMVKDEFEFFVFEPHEIQQKETNNGQVLPS
jgi:O-acetyl-ADP-ribose deacetylase (regulator of RNase III)